MQENQMKSYITSTAAVLGKRKIIEKIDNWLTIKHILESMKYSYVFF